MWLSIIISAAVCLLGLLIFQITDKKVSKIGICMFWVGLLVTLLSVQGVVYVEAHPRPVDLHEHTTR